MSLLPVGFGASGDDYEITDSLRLRDSASASLTRTPSTAPTNAKKFTLSVWVKLGIVNNYGYIYNVEPSNYTRLYTYTDGKMYFDLRISNTNYTISPTRVFRDPSAWYHIVWAVDTTQATASDRVSIYINGVKETSFSSANYPAQNGDTLTFSTNQNNIGQYNTNAHHFDGYLTEFHGIDGQALTADDFGEYDANGTWKAKRYTGTYGTNGFYLPMKPTTQAELQNTVIYSGNGSTQSIDGVGYAPDLVWLKGRTTAYNHRLYDTVRGSGASLIPDSTNAEGFLSGLDSFQPDGFTLGTSIGTNNTSNDYVAWTWDAGDNQPSTGHNSVLYYGTGTERKVTGFGFSPDLIIFKNRAAASPLLIDSVRGPFKELQPNSTGAETSNSGTRIASIDADGFSFADTAVGGLNASGNNYVAWGWDAGDGDPVSNTTGDITSTVKANDATGFSIVSYTGNGTNGATVGHGLSTTPSVVIVKDRNNTNNWAVYHKDLTSTSHSLVLNSSAAEVNYGSSFIAPAASTLSLANGSQLNASSRAYIAYCFSEVSGVSKFGTYPGNGSSNGPTVTGLGFRPGFVLVKAISTGQGWTIWDSTRGPFNTITESLSPNASSAEANFYTVDFNDDGFQLKSSYSVTNQSGQTYMYMAFKGSYSDHVSPLNDDGTIDSRVKANPDKGFSIVSYEGTGAVATVGHGLSAAPDMLIVKERTSTSGWVVYTSMTGAGQYLSLHSTAAASSSTTTWNNTTPTSSVFSLSTSGANNQSGQGYIAYCFSEVAGYSKIDSYTGTGVAGLSVTTGFRPAFVMTKRTDSTSNWNISDSRRSPTGTANTTALRANTADTENTVGTAYVKFTDTGFEITGTSTETNASGGTYIYMAFADTADAVFNFDASGNKNNWLPNNINSSGESETTYDLMKDTPSLVDENAANFATLNPLQDSGTLSNGNLRMTGTFDNYRGRKGTIQIPSSGKWYWEYNITVQNTGAGNWTVVGVCVNDKSLTGYPSGTGAIGYGDRNDGRNINNEGTEVTNSSNIDFSTGDVLQVAYDVDTGKFWFGRNNTWFDPSAGNTGNPSTGANATLTAAAKNWHPFVSHFSNNNTTDINFGQRPFAYTPPTGFLKLNTFNLPDSTIEDGSDYFTPVLYSGNSSTQSITGVGFQPDLVWTKDRNSYVHVTAVDAVRGAPLDLFTSAQNGDSNDHNGLTAFTADGFNLGSSTNHNVTGHSYVAWNWLAGNSTSTNTSGSVNSTVSVNTTAGFSIVGFTSPSSGSFTMGHGLGASPDLIIMKRRASSSNWGIFHSAVCTSEDNYFIFNSNALISYTDFWGAALPTSTVFGANVGASAIANEAMIAWCWRAVEGYSAFGKYTGNGSTDGTFVYTGFRPAYILVKSSSGASNNIQWNVYDTTRGTFNPIDEYTLVSTPDVESNSASTYYKADILSNGFKLRASGVYGVNQNNCVYAYAAFAENPFKNANAR